MAKIIDGRVTHRYEGELVVFHIGMRVNKWWQPDLWLPPYFAMVRMLRELGEDPDSGLLGGNTLIGVDGLYQTQYWSSAEKLYAYASQGNAQHRPAWNLYYETAKKSPDSVGIWHETFLGERAESMYVSTPPMGLPKATELVRADRGEGRARKRFDDGQTAATAPKAEASGAEHA